MELLLHIPHASTAIPDRSGYVVDDDVLQRELLLLTDWHTDDLYGNDQDTAVVAPFSRLFCDAERFPDDAREVMAATGMGVLYTRTDNGLPMRTVDAELRERILRNWYTPHHDRLRAAVQEQLHRHGTALIVDCHSYPDEPLQRDLDRTPGRPTFSIGTDPLHTPPALIEASVAYFAAHGHTLAIDRPRQLRRRRPILRSPTQVLHQENEQRHQHSSDHLQHPRLALHTLTVQFHCSRMER
jgi:N-formylglutamate amidohydrolase